MQTLKRVKRWTVGYGIISTIICLLLIFYPSPYELMVGLGLFLPLVGIGLVFLLSDAVFFDDMNKSVIPSIGLGTTMLAFALLLRSMTDWKVLDLSPLYLPGLGVSLAMLIAIGFADQSLVRRWKQAVTIILITVMYGSGAVLFVNGYFDNAEPHHYSAKVFIEKHEGKCNHLMIAPPGPYFAGDQVNVPDRYIPYLQAGDGVDVAVKPGLLGAPRFVLFPEGS